MTYGESVLKPRDKIAQNMGYDKESYARIRSGIMYALNEFANDGHCFAKKDELVNKASELLGVELEKVETAIQAYAGREIRNNGRR